MEKALLWKRDILADPKFNELPDQDRVKVAKNYFDKYVNTEDFQLQPIEIQEKVKGNLFGSLQREAPFKAKHPGLYAAGMTVAGMPASLGEFGRSVMAGATAGISDWVAEKGAEFGAKAGTGKDYELRKDGTTKGPGFIGEIKLPDGTIATELSIGVDFGEGEQEIPLLVPTLTPEELKAITEGTVSEEAFQAIAEKAIAHAQDRLTRGKSPFMSVAEQRIRPLVENYLGEDVENIPEYMKTAGHMLGMFAPIGLAHKGITWAIGGVKGLLPSSKWAGTLARTGLWGAAGSGYHTVERATAGTETTAADVAIDAAMWGGIEAVAQSLGWGGRFIIAANRLAKTTGFSRSMAAEYILLEAKKEGLPVLQFAQEYARFAQTSVPAQAQRTARRTVADSLGIALEDMPVQTSIEKAGVLPTFPESEAAKKFLYEVDKLINGKIGTYQSLVDKIGAQAAAAQAKIELENLRLSQMKVGEESGRSVVLSGTTLSAREADALAMQVIELQRKPSFLWTAEEKIFMKDFLRTDRAATAPPGIQSELLPPPQPVKDPRIISPEVVGVGEKSIFDQPRGMGPRTPEAEAGLKRAQRKPRKDKGVPRRKPEPEVVNIPDELRTSAQIAAEGKRYGLVFQGLTELPEQVPKAEFFDPITRKAFVKETNESVADALAKHRIANKAEPPGPPSDLPEKFPALRVDGKVYVARTPDGTNHSLIYDSLPENAIKDAKNIESGWSTAAGENFSKNMYGAVAGIEVSEDGTIGINPELAAIGMIGGRALTTKQGVEIFQSKLRTVLEGARHIPKTSLQHLEKFLWKKGVTKDETAYLLAGIRDRKIVSREEVLEEVALKSGQFKEVVYSSEHGVGGPGSHGTTKFSTYQEPGAIPGSYREVFVTAPSITPAEKPPLVRTAKELADALDRIIEEAARLSEVDRTGLTQDALHQLRERFLQRALARPGVDPAIILHKMLRVKEVNWFLRTNPEFFYSIAEPALALRHPMPAPFTWKDGHGPYDEVVNPIVRLRYNVRNTSDGKKLLYIEEMQGPVASQQKNIPDWIRDRIYDIGTKRAISIAKEQGLDGVAITPGVVQAERYSLRKQLESISWEATKEGQTVKELMIQDTGIADAALRVTSTPARLITMTAKDAHTTRIGIVTDSKNKIIAAYDSSWVGKQLDEVLPKEHTARILSAPEGTLTGEALEIGGEGLKRLYDERIPALLKKYGKEDFKETALTGKHRLDKFSVDYDHTLNSWLVYDSSRRILGSVRDTGQSIREVHDAVRSMLRTSQPEARSYIPITDKTPLTYNMYSTAGGLSGFNIDEEANVTFDPYIAAAGFFGGFGAGKFLRRPPKKSPARPDKPGKEVAEMFDRTERAIADIVKTRWEPWKDWLMKAWVSSNWLSKRMAREFNPELGRELVEVSNAIGGVNSRTRLQYQEFEGKIYNHLSNRELDVLDRLISAERAVAIKQYKPEYTLQEGKAAEQFRQYINNLKEIEGLTDVQLARIKDSANEFFNAELTLLKQYREAGIISQRDFENMSRFRYSPRVQLDQIAALDHKISGRTLDLSRTGLADLGAGAESLVDIRSKQLLHHNTMKANFVVAKARANNTLLKLADEMAEAHTAGTFKDVPWIRRAQPQMKDGKIVRDASGNVVYEKPGLNEEAIHTMIDGKQVTMIADKGFASSWLGADTAMMPEGVKFLRWASFTQFVKPIATGINPAFIIANIPMDVGTVLTGKQYSSFLPLASAQMLKDMKTVAGDVVRRTGRYHDYINEYGGMEFLSLYGRIGKEDSTMAALESVLGWAGLTSELLVRLAHRERSIINYTKDFVKKHGRQPTKDEIKDIQFRATQWARDHGPDYAQAGNIAKVLDQAAPYFNATIQANRVLVQNIYENPARFAFHLAQLWAVGTGIYAWNNSINPEAYEQISPFDKATNWVFCLPDIPGYTSYIDKDNQKRYRYLKIRKVPGLMPLLTPMDSLVEFIDKGKVPDKQIWEALEYQVPPFMPPSIAMIAALAGNADTHFWNAIWRGPAQIEEYRKFNPGETEKVFINVAHHLNQTIGLDLSPAQLEAAFHKVIPASNPIVTGGISLMNVAASVLDGPHTIEPASKSWDEKISKDPTIRRITGTTHPIHSPERQRAYEIITEVKGVNAEQYMRMSEMTDEYMRNRTPENLDKVRDYIYSQPPKDWERLDKQFMDNYELRDLPDRGYWVTLKRAPVEARARILFDRVLTLPSEERQTFIDTANAIPGLITPAVLDMWDELVADYTPPRGQ